MNVLTAGVPAPRGARMLAMMLPMALGAALLVLGSRESFYNTQLLAIAFLYATVAVSMDIAWGYTGILSMCQAVFFGMGDYGVGLLAVQVSTTGVVAAVVTHWWTYPAGMLVGIAAAMAVAFVVAEFAFSAKGTTPFYVAVVTLFVTVIGYTIFLDSPRMGGQNGLSGFAMPAISAIAWYWIAAGTLLAVITLAFVVVRSDLGLLLMAIRDNEQRCHYLGFDVRRIKLGVFVVSAGVSALAGALYGGYVGFVSPPLVGFLFATEIIIWTAVGGRGTILGPAVGAILIGLVGPRLSASMPFVWSLFLGLLFIAVVTFIPAGIFPACASGIGSLIHAFNARGAVRRFPKAPAGSRELFSRAAEVGSVPPPSSRDGVIMSAEEIYRAFGALLVLRGVSIDVRRGELLCIVGPNGAGKSTFLGVLSDGTVPHRGSVRLRTKGDHQLRGLEPYQIVRAGIGRKFQTPNLFESLTSLETVLLAGRRGRPPSPWRRSRRIEVPHEVSEIFRSTGLLEAANMPTRDLPHGLKQALELAMTVAIEPEILLLDEPTAGLTTDERNLIGRLLKAIVRNEGITVVLIEHDFDFIRRIADRIAVLHDGRMLLIGSVAEVAASDLVRKIYLGSGI
jgi:urea transport system permease protein/urea transport system ATP-binding protein